LPPSSPFSASASRQLGQIHYRAADYDRAEQELRKSFELDPFSIETLLAIGALFQQRADLSASRTGRNAELRKSPFENAYP